MPPSRGRGKWKRLWGDPLACVSSTSAAEHLQVREEPGRWNRQVKGWADLKPKSPRKDLRLRVEGVGFGATVQPCCF